MPAAPALAQTAPDTAPPEVLSFGFGPAAVDVTNGPASVTVTTCVRDATRVGVPSVVFTSDTTTQGVQDSSDATSVRISGNDQEACYRGQVRIGAGAAPGPWSPLIFPIRDSLGNSTGLVYPSGKLTVVNGPVTPPPVAPPVGPPVTPTPTPPRPVAPSAPNPAAPVQVAPRVTAQPRAIGLGQSSLVTVDGAAGAAVELLAYTRPGTAYRVVRRGTLSRSGDFGRIAWNVAPAGNTRLYARVGGRNSPTTTINVAATSTISVSNVGGTYRFAGAVQPVAPGQTVTLLRSLPGGGAALVGRAATSQGGVWRVDRRFGGSGTFGFYAVTATTANNVSGRSRSYVVAVSPPPAPRPQSIGLSVARVSTPDAEGRASYRFSGRVANGANVPVTLARSVNGGPFVGVLGGRASSTGAYTFTLRLDPAEYGFRVLTSSARSRAYGLVVPGPASDPLRGRDEGSPYPFANCDEARAAGEAPVLRGDPGYSRDLDRDGDGIGCES